MKTIYEQLHAACFASIQHYHSDLVEADRLWLEENPRMPFLHWTRRCGTSLQPLPPADSPWYPPPGKTVPYLFGEAGRVHICNQIKVVADYWLDHEVDQQVFAVHWFDGKTLCAATCQKAVEIAATYVRATQQVWFDADQRQIDRCTSLAQQRLQLHLAAA